MTETDNVIATFVKGKNAAINSHNSASETKKGSRSFNYNDSECLLGIREAAQRVPIRQ